MTSTLDACLSAMRAIGEPTRLRIVAALAHGELSVGELTEVLDQSQPRVSRHLRLLVEAAAVVRHREGNRVFFSLASRGPGAALTAATLDQIDPDDDTLAVDRRRLDHVRRCRADAAETFFSGIAKDWDRVRALHADDAVVEATIRSVLADRPYESVLDVGTGTGRMLELLAADGVRLVGLDSNPTMLSVARANLESIDGVELRQGDILNPPVRHERFDIVIVHQVLHYLDDPNQAVESAARLVSPGGRLVVVDFAAHQLEHLHTEFAHRRLGFDPPVVAEWMQEAGLTTITTTEVAASSDDLLSVVVWRGIAPERTA